MKHNFKAMVTIQLVHNIYNAARLYLFIRHDVSKRAVYFL